MPLAVGTRLGPYEILAPLGAGGMGEVYRARDTQLKRDVALKVLPEAFARDPERMARFQREAEVLASLNHPNIAAIYGVAEGGGVRALVMELVEGESPKGPMGFDDAWRICEQIAAALEYAHDRGVIHRDLKPANVKVTPEGTIKLLDFGLAKAFSNQREPSASPENSPTLTMGATEFGVILGTAAYMAPEQARGKVVDKRADIWAFGVVLYELLTGERLFQGEDAAETLAAVIHKQPDFARAPSRAQNLLRDCLEKDPKRRLRDIGDAKRLLTGGAPDVTAPSRLGRGAWVVAGIFAAAVALWAPWRTPPAEAAPYTFNVDPPNGETFFGGFSLSPDGRQLVAPMQDSSGQRYLRVRHLDSFASQRLPDTEGALVASWSPDSRYLVFNSGGKIKKIDVTGGPPQTLCDAPSNGPPFTAWSRDGVILFSGRDGLWRVSASGGSPVQVTALDASGQETQHFWPQFLPDGRHFLFWITNRKPARTALFSGSLESPPVGNRNLVSEGMSSVPIYAPGPRDSGYLLFEREGALMAQSFDTARLQLKGEAFLVAPQIGTSGAGSIAVSNNGSLAYAREGIRGRLAQFAWFDRGGRHLSDVGPPGLYGEFSLSPDEKRLAVQISGSVWTLDLTRDGIFSRFTFDFSRHPIWSPDGARIIFTKGGSSGLYEKPASGTGAEQPLRGSVGIPTDWSRDARYLLSTNNDDLWILADGKSNPFQRTESAEREGQFSPDGKWIAYTSDDSKRPEVYVQSFPATGGKWLISIAGGSQPRWRRDGRELFYLAPDGKLMAVPINTVGGFEYGTAVALFQALIQDYPTADGYAVAGEGQRFLIRTISKEAKVSPVTVMTNWLAAVRK